MLDLGLEDWIPLPEAVETAEVRALVPGDDAGAAVGRTLADLLASGEIALYRGHWAANDPDPVPRDEAMRLLRDPVWFSYRIDDPHEERLYFVNVANIRR